MSEKQRTLAQLVNKNGTPAEITNDNKLKVDSSGSTSTATISGSGRTPNILRTVGPAGTITPLTYSFSVANVGGANGTILGQTIKPGESFNFDPGINNFYLPNTVTYDGTGTELVIIYNT